MSTTSQVRDQNMQHRHPTSRTAPRRMTPVTSFATLSHKEQSRKTGRRRQIEADWNRSVKVCLPASLRPKVPLNVYSKVKIGSTAPEADWWQWSKRLLEALAHLSLLTAGRWNVAEDLMTREVERRQQDHLNMQRHVAEILASDVEKIVTMLREELKAFEDAGGKNGQYEYHAENDEDGEESDGLEVVNFNTGIGAQSSTFNQEQSHHEGEMAIDRFEPDPDLTEVKQEVIEDDQVDASFNEQSSQRSHTARVPRSRSALKAKVNAAKLRANAMRLRQQAARQEEEAAKQDAAAAREEADAARQEAEANELETQMLTEELEEAA